MDHIRCQDVILRVTSCHVMLCHVMLCYVMLCYVHDTDPLFDAFHARAVGFTP